MKDARINININQGLKEALDEIVESELNLTLQDLLRQAILRALIFWWLKDNKSSVTIHLRDKDPIVILNDILPGSVNLKYFGFEAHTSEKSRINLALPDILKRQIEAIANEQMVSAIDIIREAIQLEIVFYKIKELKGTVIVNIPEQNPITIVSEHFVVNLNPNDLQDPSTSHNPSLSTKPLANKSKSKTKASGMLKKLKGTSNIPELVKTGNKSMA